MTTNSVGANLEAAPENFDVPDLDVNKTKIIVRRFFRNRGATIGFFLFILVVLVAFLTEPILRAANAANPAVPFYEYTDLDTSGAPPSGYHWLGTNLAGADMLSLLLVGLKKSLLFGVICGVAVTIISAFYGSMLAYFGKTVDRIGLFILEALVMIPSIIIVAIVMNGSTGGMLLLGVIYVLLGWMGSARLIRALTLQVTEREYVKAARYMGQHPMKVITRHVIPNIGSILVLNATTGIWSAILAEVAYSFLGIGVKIPETSLGVMLQQATQALTVFPWMFWVPVIGLTFITGSLALMNDGLRDALDPNSLSGGKA